MKRIACLVAAGLSLVLPAAAHASFVTFETASRAPQRVRRNIPVDTRQRSNGGDFAADDVQLRDDSDGDVALSALGRQVAGAHGRCPAQPARR